MPPAPPSSPAALTVDVPPAASRPRRPRAGRLAGDPVTVAALLTMCAVVTAAVAAPWVTRVSPASQDTSRSLRPPGPGHWLGTDQYGRDVYSRLVYGARISLGTGTIAVTILLTIGTALGAVAGYYGGVVDAVLMRVVDVMLSVPQFFLVLAFVALFGPGVATTTLVIGLTSWMGTARIVRAHVLILRSREFVLAARAAGAGAIRILRRHLLPNAVPLIIVQAALSLSGAILAEASLSYLGLGAQPPTPSWGAMVNDGRNFLRVAWWLTVFPGLAVFATVLSLNLIGDRLREALDPRLRA